MRRFSSRTRGDDRVGRKIDVALCVAGLVEHGAERQGDQPKVGEDPLLFRWRQSIEKAISVCRPPHIRAIYAQKEPA